MTGYYHYQLSPEPLVPGVVAKPLNAPTETPTDLAALQPDVKLEVAGDKLNVTTVTKRVEGSSPHLTSIWKNS